MWGNIVGALKSIESQLDAAVGVEANNGRIEESKTSIDPLNPDNDTNDIQIVDNLAKQEASIDRNIQLRATDPDAVNTSDSFVKDKFGEIITEYQTIIDAKKNKPDLALIQTEDVVCAKCIKLENELIKYQSEYQSEISRLTASLDESQNRIIQLEIDSNSLKTTIKLLESKDSTAINNDSNCQEELSAALQKISILENESKNSTSSLFTSAKKIGDLEKVQRETEEIMSKTIQMNSVLKVQCEENRALLASKDSEIAKLQEIIASKSNANDVEYWKTEIMRLNDGIHERDARLAAFEHEGQSLAKKQSEMEKAVRKSKTELKTKESEIAKLLDEKADLVRIVDQTQEQLRKHELEANQSNKSVVTFQTVNTNLQDKICNLEVEVLEKNEEINSLKKGLESAWLDQTDLKKSIAELKLEKEGLLEQLGKGSVKVLEIDTVRRDAEQREAILKATNEQLQDSLNRYTNESNIREDRLRSEVIQLRQQWQNAVKSRETLASELTVATAPLIKQLSSAQESLRSKTDQVLQLENILSENRLKYESSIASLMKKHSDIENENQKIQVKLEAQLASIRNELESVKLLLNNEIGASNDLSSALKQKEDIITGLLKDEKVNSSRINELQSDLNTERAKNRSLVDEIDTLKAARSVELPPTVVVDTGSRADSTKLYVEENVQAEDRQHNPSMVVPHVDVPLSVALSEKNSTVSMLKLNTEKLYHRQIQQLETAHKALVEELSIISSRNTELEEFYNQHSQIALELQKLQRENEVLLSMLGEKSEELEATTVDMKEVKYLYRAELDDLISFKLSMTNAVPDHE